MSDISAVRLILFIACTFATLTDSARPLEDDELSTVVLGLLETSAQPHHLAPPHLSPAHRGTFSFYRKPPTRITREEYSFEGVANDESRREKSPRASSRGEFDQNASEEAQRRQRQYTYSNVLHKNPAGPNPIGNEYRPGNTIHNVKKYRYPPQG